MRQTRIGGEGLLTKTGDVVHPTKIGDVVHPTKIGDGGTRRSEVEASA